jgi:hypothetical protein
MIRDRLAESTGRVLAIRKSDTGHNPARRAILVSVYRKSGLILGGPCWRRRWARPLWSQSSIQVGVDTLHNGLKHSSSE